MRTEQVRAKAAALMPELVDVLRELVAIPSIAFPGYPPEPVQAMAQRSLELVRAAGFTSAELMEAPSGYPPIYGEIAGPEGSPTVLLYAHYDVQPAPAEQGWSSDPWVATPKADGRIYGRGAADDKGGLVTHLGTLRIFDGLPPCTVKILVEGMEETDSNIEAFIDANPDLVKADLYVVCDTGNLRAGEPTMTTSLRGDVSCIATVRTLDHPLHSGMFGGPAPDAMVVMARLIATLHDAAGDVAVQGVSRLAWEGEQFDPADFRAGADLGAGVELIGSRPVADMLWSEPSVSVIGLDMTSIAGSSNALIPAVSAKISMRIVAGADPDRELDALIAHLHAHVGWGAQLDVSRVKAAPGFTCATTGPGYAAARRALEQAYGQQPSEAGAGGSIPLLSTLQSLSPAAEFILWGPEDLASARIHGSDESVDPSEIEKMVIAQALLLELLPGCRDDEDR